MATCHSCFKKVPEDTPHCPFCGAGLTQPKSEVKNTVFGYAPSPQQLQELAQQHQQQQQQAAQAPAPAPAPVPAPLPQQPVVRQTAPQHQVSRAGAGTDAMAATMFAPSDAKPAQPNFTPNPNALMSPASLPSSTRPHTAVPTASAPTPAPFPAPMTPRPVSVPPTMAVAAAPPAYAPPTSAPPSSAPPSSAPPIAAPPASDPFAVPATSTPAAAAAAPAAARPSVATTPGQFTPVKRVATAVYIIFLSAGWLITALLAAVILPNLNRMDEAVPAIPLGLLMHFVFTLILLAKAWGAIQDGQTRISKGKAIGFLFIPFFNLYWVFRAFGGWAGQYNAFIQRNGIDVPRMGGALFIVQAVLMVIPYVNFVIAPLFMIFTAIKFCGGINRLAAATNG